MYRRSWSMSLFLLVFCFTKISLVQACPTAYEYQAMDLLALKTVLMETAIDCSQWDDYNVFATRQRPALVQAQLVVARYLRHANRGRDRGIDQYTTDLANSLSSSVMGSAADFCPAHRQFFDTIMAMSDPKTLAAYAQTQHYPIPGLSIRCRRQDTP